MYRDFKRKQSPSIQSSSCSEEKVDAIVENEDTEEEDEEFDVDVQSQVQELWKEVEKRCQYSEIFHLQENNSVPHKENLDWKTIHVFVSSTFTDFFSEREVLVKKVFPELREWCQEHRLKLIECDLRWGIPKDTSTSDTILICLDEIDRCREVNAGKPFFINLVGERYGWVPSSEETPDEAKDKYQWIPGASITFMEILHGAYRDQNPNAAFFLRNATVLDHVPDNFQARFRDNTPLAQLQLRTMKRKIKHRFPGQVFPYCCKFKEVSVATGREQVEFTDFEEFHEKVVNFLKSAIERTYPTSTNAASDAEQEIQETNLHWLFAVDKAKDLIGREPELTMLKEFLLHEQPTNMEEIKSSENKPSVRLDSDWSLLPTDRKICVLEGPSGWGKTSVVCQLILDVVKMKGNLFYHLVNSSPTSKHTHCLLKRLIAALHSCMNNKDLGQETETENIDDLKKLLNETLIKFREHTDTKLMILIDGVNELDDSDTVSHLSWLPPRLPQNISCLVSTSSDHLPTKARLYEHPCYQVTLSPMSVQELKAVATRYLDRFSKKLEDGQIDNLMTATGVDNPLWMLIMAEELRIFGDFRVLAVKINSLPNSMEGLLVHVIERLIHEDDENMVIKKVLCLTACSRHGLPLEHILKICGDTETREELAPLYWARAHRTLKPYLRIMGRQEEVITFAHQAVLAAVGSHLLSSQQEVSMWHSALANFYQFWCMDARSRAYHLPYHLETAQLKQRLLAFLREDPDSYIHVSPWMRSSMVKSVRCQMMAYDSMQQSAPLMLCHMCSMKNRSYNPACNWQNKNCCFLCGALCMGNNTHGARACTQHAFKYRNGQCALCPHRVMSNATQALLCMHCSFGLGRSTCACFVV